MSIRPHYWTQEEYLVFERTSNSKHEYFDGQIYDMVGASFNHNLIAANVHFALRSALGTCPCFVLQSDLRVALQNAYVYPDVVVVCGTPQLIDQDILINPTLIVEVLSPSTEGQDRGTKWQRYQRLESLQDYLLVSQDAPQVEHFTRQSAQQWLFTLYEGLEIAVALPKLGVSLPLSAIYANILFAESE
jgi:Uma2 family endonuclease